MPSLTNKNRQYLNQQGASRAAGLMMLLFWLAILALVAANRQSIYDWWRLHNYQAPAAVSTLADQDTMTPYARKVFYVNRPELSDKSNFSKVCRNDGGEQTIVLGCYHGSQTGIYLLDVSDPRLNGVEQVTAAHEMLHAAYDRLSSKERAKVDAMLQDYYLHQLQDDRILKTINAYKKTEPDDVVNEMHSIFGSEIKDLPAPLESYYQKYFSNRSQVAGYAAQYEAEFSSRRDAIANYDKQLADLKAQIDAQESDLGDKQAEINNRSAQLNSLRSNPSAYNAAVPAYNALIDDYNAEVRSVQSLIRQYNQVVATRNAVALEEDQLVQDLTSSAQPLNR